MTVGGRRTKTAKVWLQVEDSDWYGVNQALRNIWDRLNELEENALTPEDVRTETRPIFDSITKTISTVVTGGTGGGTTAGELPVFTEGSVPWADHLGNLYEDNASFFWKEATSSLFVGTNTPTLTGEHVFGLANGTAPSTAITDGIQMWAQAHTDGPHTLRIMGENGNIWIFDNLSAGTAYVLGTSVEDLTQGSVLFVDSDGLAAQDNANFFFDNSNDNLGIGTNTFGTNAAKTIAIAGSTAPTTTLTDGIHLYEADSPDGAGTGTFAFQSETNRIWTGTNVVRTTTYFLGIDNGNNGLMQAYNVPYGEVSSEGCVEQEANQLFHFYVAEYALGVGMSPDGHANSVLAGDGVVRAWQQTGYSMTAGDHGFEAANFGANSNKPVLALAKSRGTQSPGEGGAWGIITAGDTLGSVQFYGDDGTEFVLGASISAVTLSGGTAANIPTDLRFSTRDNADNSFNLVMSILNSRNVVIGGSASDDTALNNLVIGLGTEPADSVLADQAYLYCADFAAGDSQFYFKTERSNELFRIGRGRFYSEALHATTSCCLLGTDAAPSANEQKSILALHSTWSAATGGAAASTSPLQIINESTGDPGIMIGDGTNHFCVGMDISETRFGIYANNQYTVANQRVWLNSSGALFLDTDGGTTTFYKNDASFGGSSVLIQQAASGGDNALGFSIVTATGTHTHHIGQRSSGKLYIGAGLTPGTTPGIIVDQTTGYTTFFTRVGFYNTSPVAQQSATGYNQSTTGYTAGTTGLGGAPNDIDTELGAIQTAVNSLDADLGDIETTLDSIITALQNYGLLT